MKRGCCMCGGSLASPIEGHSDLPYACWSCWTTTPLFVKREFYRLSSSGIAKGLVYLKRYWLAIADELAVRDYEAREAAS